MTGAFPTTSCTRFVRFTTFTQPDHLKQNFVTGFKQLQHGQRLLHTKPVEVWPMRLSKPKGGNMQTLDSSEDADLELMFAEIGAIRYSPRMKKVIDGRKWAAVKPSLPYFQG